MESTNQRNNEVQLHILLFLIVLDVIFTSYHVGLRNVPEMNPIINWVMVHFGILGMAGFKLFPIYFLLKLHSGSEFLGRLLLLTNMAYLFLTVTHVLYST